MGRRNRAFEAPAIIEAFTDLERQLASPEGNTRTSEPTCGVGSSPQPRCLRTTAHFAGSPTVTRRRLVCLKHGRYQGCLGAGAEAVWLGMSAPAGYSADETRRTDRGLPDGTYRDDVRFTGIGDRA